MTAIPQRLAHIWIGPKEAPFKWMETWQEKHPSWQYTLYDNDFLNSYNFKNRKLIDRYWERQDYPGVADVMRYEILHEFGGLIAEADSVCYHNTDELWTRPCAYTVYENEFLRGKLVSPIYACQPGNSFVKFLIDELHELKPVQTFSAFMCTGNLFVARMIEKYQPDITIFPSYYFIPVHFEGVVYSGTEKVYAKQLFGSTTNKYSMNHNSQKNGFVYRLKTKKARNALKRLRREVEENRRNEIATLFEMDFS